MEYLYDTHVHTCQSSACGRSPGAEHARNYHSVGYTSIIVTDHFFGGNSAVPRDHPWKERIHRFCAGYEDAWNEGQKVGLDVFFGWEETFNGDDYLVYGLSPQWLMEHPEVEHWNQAQQYRAVRRDGGCVIQAHPFRERDYIQYITLAHQYCDGVEVANAGNLAYMDAAARLYAERFDLFVTAGSDNHHSYEGLKELGKLFGVALPDRLTSVADYVDVILNRKPLRLLVPPERFDIPEETLHLNTYWVDDEGRFTPTGVSWLGEAVGQ